MLSQVKLIAEPWDLGDGGYQVGNFPLGWAEWNDQYRDAHARLLEGRRRPDRRVRAAASPARATCTSAAAGGRTRASTSSPRTTASRCTTSSATTTSTTRPTARTTATATTTTCSWNCGVEGPTDDPAILALRERQKRNFLATLLLSQGVPMLLAGDEIGRTQGGNNNAYCQDNEISWLDWDVDAPSATRCCEFVRRADRAAARAPGVPAARLLPGPRRCDGADVKDIVWLSPTARR